MNLQEMHDHQEDVGKVERCREQAYRRGVQQALHIIRDVLEDYPEEKRSAVLTHAINLAQKMRFSRKKYPMYMHMLVDQLRKKMRP